MDQALLMTGCVFAKAELVGECGGELGEQGPSVVLLKSHENSVSKGG